jgi:hypothetical protein
MATKNLRVETPKSKHFVFSNWFAWILEARAAGYSLADIRFVLKTVGVFDDIRAIVDRANEN